MNEDYTGATEVETPEPTAPETSEGAEEQESTAPARETDKTATGGKTTADAAFAEMRRGREAAEKEAEATRQRLAELESKLAEHETKKTLYRDTFGNEDADLLALAEERGVPLEEIEEIISAEAAERLQREKDRQELEEYRQRAEELEAEKTLSEDLQTIQKIDPSIKDLADLGEEFIDFMLATDEEGNPLMTAEEAYYATMAKKKREEIIPPKPMGKFQGGAKETDVFTEEQLNQMSRDELNKHYKKVRRSFFASEE